MCSELATANTDNCTGTLFNVLTHVTPHWDHVIWWQPSWCCPLFLFAVSYPDVIVDCIAVNMRHLLNHILYGFLIGFLWLMYTHYIYQRVHYMLKFCWQKWECYILHAFIHIIFRVRIITMYITLPCAMCVLLWLCCCQKHSVNRAHNCCQCELLYCHWVGECKFSCN